LSIFEQFKLFVFYINETVVFENKFLKAFFLPFCAFVDHLLLNFSDVINDTTECRLMT